MAARRALVVLIVLLAATGLGTLLIQVLAPGGWTLAKLVMMAAFAGAAPWTGLCLANGLIGFVILLVCRNPVQAVFPVADAATEVPPLPRTAIAMTVREEDMRRVLPPLRRLLRDLDLAGHGDAFAVFVLSDTRNGPAADAEEQAVATFRAEDREPARIHYRRRADEHGVQSRQRDGVPRAPRRGVRTDADARCRLRDVGGGGAATRARDAGGSDIGDRAASDGRIAGAFRLPAAIPVRHARRDAYLGDRAGLVAGRRRPLLGAQCGGAHRTLSRALPDADPARRAAHPIARPGRGGGAACGRLGSARAAGRERVVGGEPSGAAGIPPPRAALAGGQHAIPAPVAPAWAATARTLAAYAGNSAVRRHAALSAVPAWRCDRGRNRWDIGVSDRAGSWR